LLGEVEKPRKLMSEQPTANSQASVSQI